MAGSKVITLTTDFGYDDPFVGVMKGVILKINPEARIVDITHGIKPQDVLQAAFVLEMSCDYFPQGSIHTVVVDPGVGSERRPVAAAAGNYFFVGPDNGVFSSVFSRMSDPPRIIEITSSKYWLRPDSPTFQGRDIFAPVAAWLSKGIDIAEFGRTIPDYERLDLPRPSMSGGVIEGEVIHIDRFGNAITNITASAVDKIRSAGDHSPRVYFKGMDLVFIRYYAQAPAGRLSALINSSGFLELFVKGGNASSLFEISRRDKVKVA